MVVGAAIAAGASLVILIGQYFSAPTEESGGDKDKKIPPLDT
jgi:hypothetical protein